MNAGAVDLTTSVGDFLFLSHEIQVTLAEECGFSLNGLRKLLLN
jgi:hypothetical protein